VSGFAEAAAALGVVQSRAMDNFIVGHALRTLLLSIAVALAAGRLPLAAQETQGENTPVIHRNRIAVLDSRALSTAHAATQDPVNGIERRDERHTAKDDEVSDATIVVRWSQLAQDNAFAIDPAMTDPFPNARGWTMMYLAMHDALNAIVPKFQQYAFFGTDRSAHPIAAAAQAARDVMNHIYPTRQAENDAELAFWLAQVSDGSRKTNGIHLGMASAAAVINARANDDLLVFGEYALQDPLEPGDYRFVPPLEFVYRPAFGNSIPFAIGSGADFLPAPPPALTSRAYAISVNETKAFGRLNSTFRNLGRRACRQARHYAVQVSTNQRASAAMFPRPRFDAALLIVANEVSGTSACSTSSR
jgi:hypothetical protein